MQCAGSRDQNHLNYCSYICCMATLKQCLYIAEQNPDTQITVYYIDLRAPGRYVKVLEKVQGAAQREVRQRARLPTPCRPSNRVRITAEDAVRGEKMTLDYDLVVRNTGMQPSPAGENAPLPLPLDEDGFIAGGEEAGIFAAGCARMPADVDALGAVRHSRRPEGGTNVKGR